MAVPEGYFDGHCLVGHRTPAPLDDPSNTQTTTNRSNWRHLAKFQAMHIAHRSWVSTKPQVSSF